MEKHHQESIDRFLRVYKKDRTILAMLLGGSIAHGFSVPESDIDISLIVDAQEFQKRKKENKLAFSLRDICTYENGYIDIMSIVKIIDSSVFDGISLLLKDLAIKICDYPSTY